MCRHGDAQRAAFVTLATHDYSQGALVLTVGPWWALVGPGGAVGWELQIALMAIDFFFGLRKAGLRSGLPDWIDVIVFSDTELSLVPGLFRVLREA